MANIASQNLRNLINTLSSTYDIALSDDSSVLVTDTISCVWDGKEYLVYNLVVSSEGNPTYKYIGDGATFLEKLVLYKKGTF